MDADARDIELMTLVRYGTPEASEQAFRELYTRYNRRLGKFFYMASRDYTLAADLIQDTFVKLWNARGRYEATGKFSTFLFQIAKNHWINVREKKLRRPATYSLDADREDRQGETFQAQFEAVGTPSPERAVLALEQERQLMAAVDVLPEKHRMVFVLSQIEGLKHKDIALILDIPEGTVKSRMFNAISKLREVLRDARQR